jgi:uncharacterized membrane protein YcaP (DUF421 family)
MDYSLTWDEALSVALAAIGLYVSLLIALRLTGRRLVAPLSTNDVAAGIAVGAVFGRAVLGYTPTLPAGVIGLGTLSALHVGTRRVRRADALLGDGPLLLVRDGQVLPDALRRARLTEDDLRVALRRASLGSWSQVGAMVLERCGTISVLRSEQCLEDALVDINGIGNNPTKA